MMREIQRRNDAQTLGPQPLWPLEKADGVVKHVVLPAYGHRLRFNLELGSVQAQVMAVVGSHHQPVTQEADRIAVGVFGRVDDLDPRHVLLQPV